MLFLQFVLYSSYFFGALKNEIPGAALKLCQFNKQFSPGILKFSTMHEYNPFTLNCSMVPCTFLFHPGSRRLGSKTFRHSSCKEKTTGSARVSRLSSRFLWLCFYITTKIIIKKFSKLCQFLFSHFNDVTSYSLVDIWMFKFEFYYLYDTSKLQKNISKVTIIHSRNNFVWNFQFIETKLHCYFIKFIKYLLSCNINTVSITK